MLTFGRSAIYISKPSEESITRSSSAVSISTYGTGVSAGKFHLEGIARFIVASYKRDVSDAARPSLPSVPSVLPYVLFSPSLVYFCLSFSLSIIPRASIYHWEPPRPCERRTAAGTVRFAARHVTDKLSTALYRISRRALKRSSSMFTRRKNAARETNRRDPLTTARPR